MTHSMRKHAILLSGFIALGISGASYAQSLPVPMPMEEKQELEQQYAGVNPTSRPTLPIRGSTLPEAQNNKTQEDLRAAASAYTIKAGSFRDFENARRLQAKLFAIGPSRIEPRRANGKDFYGVYLGPWKNEADAFTAYSMALDAGMQDGEIIQE